MFGIRRDKAIPPATTMGDTKKEHLGNCYEYAARFALANELEGWGVCHGTIKTEFIRGTGLWTRPLDHAWAWLGDGDNGLVYEPATDTVYTRAAFDKLFTAEWDAVYDRREWRRACLEYKHFGPWDGSCPPVEPVDDDYDDEDEDW